MSNKWILLLCFVLVTMGAADGRNKKGGRNSNRGTRASPCFCRDKDGCKKGSSCPSGCYPGWATEQCKKSTYFNKTCEYNKNHTLTCTAECHNRRWDGPYCSRENVMKKNRLPNGEINDTCKKITKAAREFQLTSPTDNPVIEFFPGNSSTLNISDCAFTVSSTKNGTECSCTHLPTGQTFAGTHLFTCQDGNCSTRNVTFLKVNCRGRTKPPAQLCLSEINVYSCKKFWFGPETGCRSHCNCQNGAPCDSMSGECPRDNPCADGFFGTNCSLVCGPCDGNRNCDMTTGQCPRNKQTSQKPPQNLTERTTPPTTMPKQSTQTTQQTTHTSSTHQTNLETVSTTQEGESTTKPGAPTTPDKRVKDGGSTEYTVAGVLFGLAACVLVAIIAFVFVYRRTMRRKMNTSCEQPIIMETPWDNDHFGAVTMSSLLQNEAQEDTAVYANCGQKFKPTLTPIPVANFRNHIGHLESTGGYAKEFEALPTNLQVAVEAATRSLDADVKKNRFKDICPYDDTRVVLTTEKDSDSDYINASYIDGFAETRAYIAAQGPLPDTVGDFWHMVWTEGCGKIVMLTNLSETGKVKCEQYWPNEENFTTTFGHYTVTLVNVTTRAFFVQRILRVVKNTSQNGDGDRRRHIHHFHFTAWPDHNVPLAAPMVEFWEVFHHVPSGLSGPLLVHCSAGVGRTGTFVGLDILIRQAETRDSISVFPTVRRMRQQRVKMVQTLSQYVFLHEVLDEWLSSRDTVVSLHDLQHDPAWCLHDGGQLTETVRAKIAAQFQLLDRLRPRPSKKLKDTALRPENAPKNRMAHILPMEHCRVCLWSPEEEDGDYINAVFLPSMATQLSFIGTQLPLRDTAADFWRMVYDWRAKIVVRFLSTPEQESDLALCPAEGCRVKFGPVTVGNDCVSPWKPGITEITLQLQSKEAEQHTQMVKVYSVDHDMTLSLTDTRPFLTLADHLLPVVGSLPQPPVVVQCFDGVGLSCTLCAVVTALQTLQVDGRASPYTLARTLQTCRPQAFSTLVQYECMVRCLLDHTHGRQTAGDAVNPTDAANGNEETSPQNAIYANI